VVEEVMEVQEEAVSTKKQNREKALSRAGFR